MLWSYIIKVMPGDKVDSLPPQGRNLPVFSSAPSDVSLLPTIGGIKCFIEMPGRYVLG